MDVQIKIRKIRTSRSSIIFPPESGNKENTDEDPDEEDNAVRNNLPGSQLPAEDEFLQDFGTYGYVNGNEEEEEEKENEAIEEVNENEVRQ
ncbi:hypothetical protein QE152_g26573 [Popillia japonica]|uniref:Uncharacterized protein n=1 Tax=Popillia japonica TaxID=7064 RepID=A0AAW1JX65_POPJA